MIICSSSNIDLIQGVTGYGTAGDGATDWRIENTATGVFNILNSPNLLAPNISIIDAGNVGIGTIPNTGTNKIQVQGNANVSGDTLSKTYTATNTTSGTNDILTMRYDTTNGLRFQQTLVAINDVRYDVIQKTNNVDSTTPVMSFYRNNVGIGTTNPNAELQITNSTTATNPDTPGTIISLYVHNPTNSASQNSVIYNRIGGTSAGKVIYAFNVLSSYGCSLVINGNDTTNRLLRFNNSSDASGTDLMVINNSNGNVSIGTTSTDTYKLNVNGSINATSVLVNGTAITAAGGTSQWVTTDANIYYNTGNVGIGTNNPLNILHLHKNATTADVRIIISDNTTTASISRGFHISKVGNNDVYLMNHENQAIIFGTNATERMRIVSGGNVGIGTNNPICNLHLHDNSGTADVRISLTDANTGANYRGIHLIKLGTQDGFLLNYENCGLKFGTNGTERMNIANDGGTFRSNNSASFNQTSDHRIKENIKKANLNICYDNVKNINLYRFNYKYAFGKGTHRDMTQMGFVAQQINQYYPKSITRGKRMLDDNREVPDLASIDISQINFTLFGAVKQLIRVVEKQSKRIKKLEEMLNIVEVTDIEDDADEPYVKIVCEGEVDYDTIVPSEPVNTQ
jgi:hypothetical protein